ncbi:MAG: hypothetical protein AAGA09_01670 [Pseudomonadota bacterium]
MTEWLASGIPAAVEASGPDFLPTLIQLFVVTTAAAGAGLFFGRFWLAREIQNKESEIKVLERSIEEQKAYANRLQLVIDTASSIEEAKEKADSFTRHPTGHGQKANQVFAATVQRNLVALLAESGVRNEDLAKKTGIPLKELLKALTKPDALTERLLAKILKEANKARRANGMAPIDIHHLIAV